MHEKTIWAILTALTVLSSNVEAGLIFTDRATWEANLISSFTTETFSTLSGGNLDVLTLDTGIVSSAVGGKHANFTNSTQTFNGGVSQFSILDWNFPQRIYAFGGDFFSIDPAPDGLSVVGNFDGNGDQTLSIAATLSGSSGFFGIIGESEFESIQWVAPNRTGSDPETFQIDDFSFASVPEPSSVYLLITGSLCLVVYLRRRRVILSLCGDLLRAG